MCSVFLSYVSLSFESTVGVTTYSAGSVKALHALELNLIIYELVS